MHEQKTVLIVEDEELLQQVLRDEFVASGFNVLQARNGVEGVKIATADKPDLMLVDILMPEMDGITMLQRIRNDKDAKDIPAIVLTNVNDVEATAKAVENKAYDYLIKANWEPKALVQHVKEKLHIS